MIGSIFPHSSYWMRIHCLFYKYMHITGLKHTCVCMHTCMCMLPTLTRSFGSSVSGSTSDSLPTHSATTFLVPSSELSKCWNSTSLGHHNKAHACMDGCGEAKHRTVITGMQISYSTWSMEMNRQSEQQAPNAVCEVLQWSSPPLVYKVILCQHCVNSRVEAITAIICNVSATDTGIELKSIPASRNVIDKTQHQLCNV